MLTIAAPTSMQREEFSSSSGRFNQACQNGLVDSKFALQGDNPISRNC